MIFKAITALAVVTSAAALPESSVLKKRDACSAPQFASNIVIGGQDGTAWCESHWPSADIINHIKVWAHKNDITCIEFGYSGNNPSPLPRYGDCSSGEVQGIIDMAPGEVITRAWLAGNGKAKHLGNMFIQTNKQSVTFGNSDAKQWELDVGSGFLVGAFGAADNFIDNMGLLFLGGQLESVSMSNFQFNPDPTQFPPDLTPQSLSDVCFTNNLQTVATATITGGKSMTASYQLTKGVTSTYGMSVSLSAQVGIPEVASVTEEITSSWSFSEQTTTSSTYTQEVDQGFSMSPPVGPGQSVDCSAYQVSGNVNFDYTCDVLLSFQDGSTFSFPDAGTLDSVIYSHTNVSCGNNTVGQPPEGFTQVPATIPLVASISSTSTLTSTSSTSTQVSTTASPSAADADIEQLLSSLLALESAVSSATSSTTVSAASSISHNFSTMTTASYSSHTVPGSSLRTHSLSHMLSAVSAKAASHGFSISSKAAPTSHTSLVLSTKASSRGHTSSVVLSSTSPASHNLSLPSSRRSSTVSASFRSSHTG